MNRRIYAGIIFAFAALACTSCASKKKMTYLQGADEYSSNPQKIAQNYELKIQPDDQLYIIVSGKNAELLEIFENNTILGSAGSAGTLQEAAGLRVDKNGKIQVPLIGEMQAEGLTRTQLAEEVRKKIIEKDYINDPTVIVQLKSFKVSVLGEVNSPGVLNVSGERITILEALSQSGDLMASARRDNILVMREENNERKTYTIDLTSAENVLNSPCYYLVQNDVIYVEPNASIRVKGSSGLTFLSAGSSIISVIASVVALFFVLNK